MPLRRPLADADVWQHYMTLRERTPSLRRAKPINPRNDPPFSPGTPLPAPGTDVGMSAAALRSVGRSEPAIRAPSSARSSIACSRSRTVSASIGATVRAGCLPSSSGSSRYRHRSDASSFLSFRIQRGCWMSSRSRGLPAASFILISVGIETKRTGSPGARSPLRALSHSVSKSKGSVTNRSTDVDDELSVFSSRRRILD